MSTQKSKHSSSDDYAHPASGQRPALRFRSDADFSENADESAGFSATCENTSLSDWIQLVQMNRRDAVIGVKRHDGKKALLWCRDGDIIDAWCDGAVGEEAVYRVLTWEGGQVSVAFAPFEHERQIEIATPALLLRAAYRKDSGVRELRPEARSPSSPAPAASLSPAPPPAVPPSTRPALPALPALPSLVTRSSSPSLSPPVRAVTLAPSSVSLPPAASSPAEADSAAKVSAPSSAPVVEPAPAAPERRRTRKRAWVFGIALGLLPVLGLTASWWITPKKEASLPAPPRRVSLHAEPSRPEVTPSPPAAANPGPEEGLVPLAATTVVPPARAPRAMRAPRQVVAAPAKAPPATAPRAESKSKLNLQPSEARAPRVQIIDERESQIEVIE